MAQQEKARKLPKSESHFHADCLFGVKYSKGGCSGWVWALFNRKDIPDEWIQAHKTDDGFDLGFQLTGWCMSDRGIGRPFRTGAACQASRNRVLVKQFRGLDV